MNKFLLLVFVAAVVGCGGTGSTAGDPFTGVFVRVMKDSVVSMDDTLHVSHADGGGTDLYSVVHRVGIVRKGDDGMFLPRQLKQQEWSGKYHQEDKTLEIVSTGEHYTMTKDGGITNGQLSYRKVM